MAMGAGFSDRISDRAAALGDAVNASVDLPLFQDPRYVRQDRHASMDVRERVYAVVVRRNNSGEPEILLKRRGTASTFQNHYDLPGGELAVGKAPIDGLKELVRRQLNIELGSVQVFGRELWQDAAGKENTVDCALAFRATISDSSITPNKAENTDGFEWMTAERLRQVKVIHLDPGLDPSKSGRMGLMILAGLDTADK